MSQDIQKVLRELEYGVYVVSLGEGNDGRAFTASWLTQVSSEPPAVAVSVHVKHQSNPEIKKHGCFVVNLYDKDQAAVAQRYYGPAESGYEKLKSAEITAGPGTGAPVLGGTVGFLDCKLIDTVEVGNHTLFIGEIVAAEFKAEKPLLTKSNSGLKYSG